MNAQVPNRGAAIDLRSVTKAYGDFRALEDVTLHIEAGEFMTLLGPSGSGKTTTLNVTAGFMISPAARSRSAIGTWLACPRTSATSASCFSTTRFFPI